MSPAAKNSAIWQQSYELLPAPSGHTDSHTLDTYGTSGGGGEGGGGLALILDRCRAFDLFASVDAHLWIRHKGRKASYRDRLMVPTILALQVVALDFLPSAEFSVPRIPPVKEETNISPINYSGIRNKSTMSETNNTTVHPVDLH